MINGIFERDELDLLSNIIDKEIFIDIGANIEIIHYTLEIAFKKIYSYEPHPKNLQTSTIKY